MSSRIKPKTKQATARPGRGRGLWRRWRTPIVLAAAVLAAVAVIAALRGGSAVAPTGGPGTAITLERAGGHQVGDTTPVFRAATTTGGEFAVPAGKPAVLFFMAGWCASCYPEAKALDRIERDFGDRVAILAVDADPSDTPGTLRRFTDAVGARYGFTHDTFGTLTRAFAVTALDTTVVIDAAGRIVYRDAAPTDEATLRTALTQAGLL